MAVFVRDLFTCQRCRRIATADQLVCDHIIPLVKGGTDDESNLQTLCGGPGGCAEAKDAEDRGAPLRVEVGVDGWPRGKSRRGTRS
ncbi:HNH endonuclease [Luteimonas sp. XNQY3]|nr:HNH endonuclease [Luteimonas sp. XNQY3]